MRLKIKKQGIVALLFFLLFISSCGKLPINGDLDGRWQLMSIEYKNGESIVPERTYYSIQLHMINLYKVNSSSLFGTFKHTDDSLRIIIRQANKTKVAPFGINDTIQSFSVETLTGNKLILNSDYARLGFRKF